MKMAEMFSVAFIKTPVETIFAKFIRCTCGPDNLHKKNMQPRNIPEGQPCKGVFPLMLSIVFVCGLLLSLCMCKIMETAILSGSIDIRSALAAGISARAPSHTAGDMGGGIEKLPELNPFYTVPKPGSGLGMYDSGQSPLKSFMLAGTLPNVGAWIKDEAGTHFVLKGQEIRGYSLADIQYGKVLVTKGGNNYPLYIILSGGNSAQPFLSAKNAGGVNSAGLDFSAVEPAADGKEGTVPRELVDKLIMNPYDEIGKMKMVPAEGGGMKLQRIAGDSVLGVVGVTQGDIIKAVNGVTISNLSDVTNAVNSMMSGTRFDVTVERGKKIIELKYQVR